MDKEALLRKLPFLYLTEDFLEVPYLQKSVRIRLCDGVIDPTMALMDEMNVYTLLWYAQAGAALTGQWLPFEQLKNARAFGPAFRKGNLAPFAATFDGHAEELERALRAFRGQPLPTGDVGYQIDVFPCIPVQVLFWDGDDEFPAQCNLLFDRSATDFIHVESVVSIASMVLKHLAEAANLPIKGPMIDTV